MHIFLFMPSFLPHPKHLAYLLKKKKYILSACNALGTVLGAVATKVNKTRLWTIYFSGVRLYPAGKKPLEYQDERNTWERLICVHTVLSGEIKAS